MTAHSTRADMWNHFDNEIISLVETDPGLCIEFQ